MKKVNIIICSVVFSLILFFILTAVQKKMIKYEPQVSVLIATQEINVNEKLEEKMFKSVLAPVGLANQESILENITDNMYAKETIYNGQILFKEDIGSKDELKIIGNELGCEIIAIKLKGPENSISYQIKPGDKVNLYFTGKYIAVEGLGVYDSSPADGKMYTAKILENEEILGIYDSNGISCNEGSFLKPDTIILSVTYEQAKLINNLRNQGTFDITR